MGVTPTTEAIHLIRYGETAKRKPNIREDGIYEWTHPNTGAVGVSLVDTPGTGSVFQKHEKTAKAFLHRSDLVIFVLSAKRALAETERLYLELARDYGKKIILVVNQVDLLNPAERQEVRRFVERQVEELLDLKPLLFMVSAKEALKAAREGGSTVRAAASTRCKAHLRGVFNETPPAQQKLLAQLDMARAGRQQVLRRGQGARRSGQRRYGQSARRAARTGNAVDRLERSACRRARADRQRVRGDADARLAVHQREPVDPQDRARRQPRGSFSSSFRTW